MKANSSLQTGELPVSPKQTKISVFIVEKAAVAELPQKY